MYRFIASALLLVTFAFGGCFHVGRVSDELTSTAARDIRAAYETLPAGGRAHVVDLYDNSEAWAARWRLIESARDTLDVVYFIVSADPFGLSFLGLLEQKARAGVQIRLLIDNNGVLNLSDPRTTTDDFLVLDRMPNVEVRTYNPLLRAAAESVDKESLVPLIAQNHDKIVLADRRTAIIGGRNIADEYFAHTADDPEVFLDKDVQLQGEDAVVDLRRAFEREWDHEASIPLGDRSSAGVDRAPAHQRAWASMKAWLEAAPLPRADLARREAHAEAPRSEVLRSIGKQPAEQIEAWLQRHPHLRGALHVALPTPVEGEVRILDSCSAAGCDVNEINRGLGRLVEAAQHELVIENPYLVLTDGGVEALERAAARGVKITILTNSPVSSDNAFTQAFFLEQYPTLLARVPTLRLFVMGEGHNVHGKLAVIDREVTVVGSYNLDFMSAGINSEVVAAVWSEPFAARSRADVLATIGAGRPHVFEYRIARDAAGRVVRHPPGGLKAGQPVVAFGAEDHCTPARWTKLALTRSVIQLRRGMPNLSPLL